MAKYVDKFYVNEEVITIKDSETAEALEAFKTDVQEDISDFTTSITEELNNFKNDVNEDLAQAKEDTKEMIEPLNIFKPCKAVAHRGAQAEAPENSYPAIHWAKYNGFDCIEIDVARTSDGQFYLMHDATVDRTTDGTGTIATMTASQVNALLIDAGVNADKYTSNRVPKFKDALNLIKQLGLEPMIEVKFAYNEAHLDSFMNIVKSLDVAYNSTFISFDFNTLKYLSDKYNVKAIWSTTLNSQNITTCAESGLYGIMFPHTQATQALIDEAHNNKLTTVAWNITTPEHTTTLRGYGVDYVLLNAIQQFTFFSASYRSLQYAGNYTYDMYGAELPLVNPYEKNMIDYGGLSYASGMSLYSWCIRGVLTEEGSAKDKDLFIEYRSNNDRAVCFQKILLKSDSVVTYTPNDNYDICIRLFSEDGTPLSSGSWWSHSATTKTGFASGTAYGYVYVRKVGNGTITGLDFTPLSKIIKSVTY